MQKPILAERISLAPEIPVRARDKVAWRHGTLLLMNAQQLTGFLWNLASTILGGLTLGFLFFLAREKCFPLPAVTGRWHVEMRFLRSSYKPYKNMKLRYVAVLWREGNCVRGTAEKVYEDSLTGKREYIGKYRTRSVIDGHIDKRIFSRDRVTLHIVEDGHGRESTHFHDLTVQRNRPMKGTFSSMAADAEGEAIWQRESF